MEGERILSVLKKRSESFESVCKDVKVISLVTCCGIVCELHSLPLI